MEIQGYNPKNIEIFCEFGVFKGVAIPDWEKSKVFFKVKEVVNENKVEGIPSKIISVRNESFLVLLAEQPVNIAVFGEDLSKETQGGAQ